MSDETRFYQNVIIDLLDPNGNPVQLVATVPKFAEVGEEFLFVDLKFTAPKELAADLSWGDAGLGKTKDA